MKKIILVTLYSSVIIFLSCTSGGSGDPNKDFAKSVFESMQKNDSAAFKKLFITADQFDALVDKTTWDDSKKTHIKQRLTQRFFDSVIPMHYREIRNGYPINWSNASIDSLVVKTKQMDGLEELIWYVYFTENKKRYRLNADKVLKTPDGWKLSNGVGIYMFEQ